MYAFIDSHAESCPGTLRSTPDQLIDSICKPAITESTGTLEAVGQDHAIRRSGSRPRSARLGCGHDVGILLEDLQVS